MYFDIIKMTELFHGKYHTGAKRERTRTVISVAAPSGLVKCDGNHYRNISMAG